MSLQSDLARNRAIFEVLTGASATADSAELRSAPRRGVPVRERAESARPLRQPAGESRPEPARSFSLAYGERRSSGMAASFEAPGDVEYPALREPAAGVSTDPLESLYYELDLRARMSSQLSGEEEF